ncbi:MAG: protein kinase [Bdellovibrionales bacterium]|nr:protein kinase [Bdellovibrionales bacterium]
MTTPSDAPLFHAGTLIAGRYEVLGTLGKGGMGVVLQVVDRALDNEIGALKLLHPQMSRDATQFARFRNEVLVARKLAHPNIVRLYDFGAAEHGYYFISMEYVDGGNLAQRIYGTREPIPIREITRILREVCYGLACAHQQGVIHRDLKPDNILLSQKHEVKLSDFGLARSLMLDKGLTDVGETVGTPYYMAPEQLKGETPDPRVDIYSLGIVAFEMAMGRRPFTDENYVRLAKQHFSAPLPTLLAPGSGIPEWFDVFVRRAAAKSREQRFATAEEAAEELARHLEGPVVVNVRSDGRTPPPPQRSLRSSPLAAAVLLLIGGLCWLGLERYLLQGRGAAGKDGGRLSAAVGQDDETARTLFFSAIERGERAEVERFIAKGTALDRRGFRGFTPVIAAIRFGRIGLLELLLASGANPNEPDSQGATPLIHAAQVGEEQAVEPLIQYGAITTARDANSRTALLYAIAGGPVSVVETLLAAGSPVAMQDAAGNGPLHYSLNPSLHSVAERKVLERGGVGPVVSGAAGREEADAERGGGDGRRFAEVATRAPGGRQKDTTVRIVRLLLGAGADAGIENREGVTPLELATAAGADEVLRLFRRKELKGR